MDGLHIALAGAPKSGAVKDTGNQIELEDSRFSHILCLYSFKKYKNKRFIRFSLKTNATCKVLNMQ